MGWRQLLGNGSGPARREYAQELGNEWDVTDLDAVVDSFRGSKSSPENDVQITVDLNAPDGRSLVEIRGRPGSAAERQRVKRVLDFCLAVLGLVVVAPLLALVMVAIRLETPGSPLFKHKRVGLEGDFFWCFKLRTMVDDAAESLPRLLAENPQMARQFAERHKLENDPRVTKLGFWLRRLNIDELPQLWNVVRGDMSLVGPRPIVEEEIVRYGRHIGEVLQVRPGVTGLWQVSGRSEITYEERVALDVQYVRSRTLLVDLRILMKTCLLAVLPSKNGAR